jgi:flagellar biosynthesis chaperone FliJ
MFEHIDVKTNGKYSMVREKIFRYVELIHDKIEQKTYDELSLSKVLRKSINQNKTF